MRISVVTPSYNQASFLEETLQSVAEAGAGLDVEHVVIDGGSKDGSVAILESWSNQLTYWHTEPDEGQYDAINRGFEHTSGDVMAWLNADDRYFGWTLGVVAEIFSTFPRVRWLTSMFPLVMREDGQPVATGFQRGFSRELFLRGVYLPRGRHFASGYIMQESTFWRRDLWDAAGGYVDTSLSLAGDFELWARFFLHAELYGVVLPLAAFRSHPAQRSRALREYEQQAEQVLRRHGGRRPTWLGSRVRKALSWEALRKLRLRPAVPVLNWRPDEGWRVDRG